MERKMLPVGFDDFKTIRTHNYYYVDKSYLIKELIQQGSFVSLFTRPRRFGKTLNMSMLRYFFDIREDAGALFQDLAISREKELCEAYMGKYPVIFFSLKDAYGLDFESAYEGLRDIISDLANQYDFLLNSAQINESEKKQLVLLQNGEKKIENSLKFLSRLLHRHYGKKVIILVDEYDVPLERAVQNGFYTQMVSILRRMFSSALKTNESLQFAVLTGCLRVSKESIFTGLNHFRVYSITDSYFDEWFGFSESEVKQLLDYYDLSEYHDEIQEWYDGYHFGDQDVYCPWDVLNHCLDLVNSKKEQRIRPKLYWLNASENTEVRTLISKMDTRIAQSEIENLIAGKTVVKEISEQLTHDEMYQNINNLWSLLFMTGYLTAVNSSEAPIYELAIPNREVREIYQKQVLAWFDEKTKSSGNELSHLYRAFEIGDAAAMEQILNEMMLNTISFYDEYESFYHGFLLALLSSCENWQAISNRETGKGRNDIFVERKDRQLGFVIEFKYVKAENKLKAASGEALCQIETKQYAAPLIRNHTPKILLYGIAFCGKQCRVSVKCL